MKILALDVSTKSTGWFVTKRSCGKIVTDNKPDVVVLEDCYYRPGFGNIHTLKALTKFAGVAIELCTAYGIETEILTATTVRKHCCGNHEGKFGKQEVFDFFVEKFDLDWTYEKHNDITDAMALSWGYREIQRTKEKGNKKKARK